MFIIKSITESRFPSFSVVNFAASPAYSNVQGSLSLAFRALAKPPCPVVGFLGSWLVVFTVALWLAVVLGAGAGLELFAVDFVNVVPEVLVAVVVVVVVVVGGEEEGLAAVFVVGEVLICEPPFEGSEEETGVIS
jgi:hypothetical protein